jgi:hypothetical protein
LVDVSGNLYADLGQGLAQQLSGSQNKGLMRTFFVDAQRQLYVKNTDGSLTYFSGLNAGTTIYSDAQGAFSLNYDGSKQYIPSTKSP